VLQVKPQKEVQKEQPIQKEKPVEKPSVIQKPPVIEPKTSCFLFPPVFVFLSQVVFE
jgi:hypothetical protein